jgi:hypothetical protein
MCVLMPLKTYSKWHAFEFSALGRRKKSANVGVEVAIVAEFPKGPHELPDQRLVPAHVLNDMCYLMQMCISRLAGIPDSPW